MRKLLVLTVLASGAALFGAGNSATATAGCGVEVFVPITISASSLLNAYVDFAKIVTQDTTQPFTATLDFKGNVTGKGFVLAPGAVPRNATFNITSDNALAYSVTLPKTPVSLYGFNGNASYTPTSSSYGRKAGFLEYLVNSSITLGGTLTVPAKGHGGYIGWFPVTVSYN